MSAQVGKKMVPARKAWNQKVQTRVATTSDVLGQIKSIKMSGLSPAISKRIQGLRVVELMYSKRLRRLIVVMHSTGKSHT